MPATGGNYLYTRDELEHAATHDPYWNAAQNEMVRTGKMQGYMRMYWGKKILEWSATPQEAYATALYLNNKYEIDGRDPKRLLQVLHGASGSTTGPGRSGRSLVWCGT